MFFENLGIQPGGVSDSILCASVVMMASPVLVILMYIWTRRIKQKKQSDQFNKSARRGMQNNSCCKMHGLYHEILYLFHYYIFIGVYNIR